MADEESRNHKTKRAREVEESDGESMSESSESHSEDSSEDSDLEEAEEIPIEFEAFSPTEDSFGGIRNLLQQLFLKSAVDLSKLSDLIISQPAISSIVKVVTDDDEQEGDEVGRNGTSSEDDKDCDIFGITTMLHFKQYKDEQCIQQIKKLLLEKCQQCADNETQTKFEEYLNDRKKTVGLLISERFINIPPQIALPLFKTLRSELEAQEQKGKQPKLDYLLMLCKSYKADEAKASKSKKAKKLQEDMATQQFSNTEDELFLKEAVLSFSFPASADESETMIGGKWSYDDAVLKPYRTVMVIPYSKMHAILSAMDQMLH